VIFIAIFGWWITFSFLLIPSATHNECAVEVSAIAEKLRSVLLPLFSLPFSKYLTMNPYLIKHY
jgi:hypothetical protein